MNNDNTNVFNDINHFNITKNNDNYANYTYLDTFSGNSIEIKPTDNTTTSDIRFNNTPISNTYKRNHSNMENESKDETIGYLKNLKEEMRKFTEFNFDFEDINKNKTPEFKEVSKYNPSYQLNHETDINNFNSNNNNTYHNAISSHYDYDCNYTLHNENNNSNKDMVDDRPTDSFCNNNYDHTSSNILRNNHNLDSVNFSKISNKTKLDNLDLNNRNRELVIANINFYF